MRKYIFICALFFTCFAGIFSQPIPQFGSIEGTIIDSLTDQPVFGAVISVSQTDMEIGTITENNGGYLVDGLQPGEYNVQIRCIGYQTLLIKKIIVKAGETSRLDIKIRYSGYEYEEQAKEELELGIVQLWMGGLLIRVDTGVPDSVYDAIHKKYGFEIIYTGCDVTGVKEHNDVIEAYLEKRNGKGWREKMNKEFDLIEKEYKNRK